MRFSDLNILLSIVVICIFALSKGAFGPLNIARTYCVPLLIFFYVKNTKFSDKEIRKIVTTCWAVATGIAVWGILQAFILDPEVLLNIGYSGENGKFSSASFYINHWDQQRVVGAFSSPNGCGAYFAVMLLFLLSMKDKADMNKAVFNCGLALIGIGMITSFSRSAWIGFAVAFVFIREWKFKVKFRISKSRLLFYSGVGLVLFLILMRTSVLDKVADMFISHLWRTVTGQDASFNYHMKELLGPVRTVLEHPFGLGFGTNGSFATSYLPLEQTRQVESSYWVMAYEGGILFAILYFSTYLYGVLIPLKKKTSQFALCTSRVCVCLLLIYLVLPSVQCYEQPFFAMLFLGMAQQDIRVYLETVNMPKQRVFSCCAAPFFLEIHPVFLRQNGLHIGKIPRCWSYFQFSDRP